MSKYAWCTDVHLDHLRDDAAVVAFAEQVVANDPTGVFLTGDISVAPQLVYHLSAIERVVQRPTFFVLGNHDYYMGDFASVRKLMRDVSNMSQFLRYAPLTTFIPLTKDTALVGHDGWYDAGYGDPLNSKFMMSDWSLIGDFVQHSGGGKFMQVHRDVRDRQSLIGACRRLAHEGTTHVMNGIKSAVRTHNSIIVLTHFPPFRESHIHQGKVGDDHAQPWFTNKMMGDMLLDAARSFPKVSFTVLAGHTHGFYEGQPAPNMKVIVGHADYGHPGLAGLIEVA